MFCPKCGTQIADTSKFCYNCGTPIARPAVPSTQAPPAATPAVSPPATPAAEKEESLTGWWILAIILGIIGGLISWAACVNRNPRAANRMLLWSILFTIIYALVIVISLLVL